MSVRLAQLLALPKPQTIDDLALAECVARGLSTAAVERLFSFVEDRSAAGTGRIASRVTLWRRRSPRERVSRDISDRLYGLARVVDAALVLFRGEEDKARAFLNKPHVKLGGRTPADLATESAAGVDVVLRLLSAR
jgi:putative toxin-antitoxin system antitoxin component (TIGR02293 family)